MMTVRDNACGYNEDGEPILGWSEMADELLDVVHAFLEKILISGKMAEELLEVGGGILYFIGGGGGGA
ncbi:hypothetical protein TIFTF001_001028 [Ficus carica]|uniref:Uncharacterized protein n=1 Tax=Ficus carica TaxID=3494 RepID=A0AA87Z711_FICCA|nr:hypothetical protein TIFTF001_001028 [Ficus carica]